MKQDKCELDKFKSMVKIVIHVTRFKPKSLTLVWCQEFGFTKFNVSVFNVYIIKGYRSLYNGTILAAFNFQS